VDFVFAELRYFAHVADAGSFTEGARRAHVTRPTVSKAIKRLERQVGRPVFDRSTRRVRLTPVGEAVLIHARRVLGAVDDLETSLEDPKLGLRGELRIGTIEAFSSDALALALARLAAAQPDLRPVVRALSPAAMEVELLEGNLDVGLCIGVGKRDRLEQEVLVASPAVAVCGRRHPLYEEAAGGTYDWQDHAFVCCDTAIEDGFPEARRVGASVELLQTAIQMVVDGPYLGYFPRVAVRCQLNHGELRVLDRAPSGPELQFVALTTTRRARVEALLEELEVALEQALTESCWIAQS
jgi:DNA-binding transcriptional LysR family regulator